VDVGEYFCNKEENFIY